MNLLLVDKRKDALHALQAQGHHVTVVHDESPTKPVDYPLILADFDQDSLSYWQHIADSLHTRSFDAVLGSSERAVKPAAFLRTALQLPGTTIDVAQICTNKVTMKQAAQQAHIPCASFAFADGELNSAMVIKQLGLPLVIKPRIGSGGRNNSLITQAQEMPSYLSPVFLAESFIRGVEMSIESFVVNGEIVFANLTEYFQNRFANILPAEITETQERLIHQLNQHVIKAFQIQQGMTHLELFLNQQGAIFGEIALRPPGGHIMKLLEYAYDFNAWHAWLMVECGQKPILKTHPQQSAGMWIYYPPCGTVKAIDGVEKARQMPGVKTCRLLIREGDTIQPRKGSGEQKGYIIVTGSDRDTVAKRLERAYERITIEILPN